MRTALDLTPRRLFRALRLLELVPQHGLALHLAAATTLLPERAFGSAVLCDLLERVVSALRERCERLFVALPAVVHPEVLEDARERALLVELAAAIVVCPSGDAELAGAAGLRIGGEIAGDRTNALLYELHRAPLGCVTPWIFACELLGTSIEYRATRSGALGQYRAALLERLTALEDQSPDVFRRRLVTSEEPELQERAAALADALRGAASLAFASV